jgi:hypothetical protein
MGAPSNKGTEGRSRYGGPGEQIDRRGGGQSGRPMMTTRRPISGPLTGHNNMGSKGDGKKTHQGDRATPTSPLPTWRR